jgi:hypothetical protein
VADKREVLEATSFGRRIAEEEASELAGYFVETEDWRRLYSGEADIVYGPKGSGKSAIYSLLADRGEELAQRGVIMVAAEQPQGAPAFMDLQTDPPTSEREFIGLWKVYLLALAAQSLRERGLDSAPVKSVLRALEEARVVEPGPANLRRLIRNVQDYVRRVLRADAIEGGWAVDPNTGMNSVYGKITLAEPDFDGRRAGLVSVDSLFQRMDAALAGAGLSLWLALDRLDVAFAQDVGLERNALRALFRVYLDMLPLESLRAKIFLRSDIWASLVEEGFREASHVTRYVSIKWDRRSLMNLVVRRALRNEAIREFYALDEATVLADVGAQEAAFYRMFPDQVDLGAKKPSTFDWMLTRTQDGNQEPAPRELIHLLSSLRETQLRRVEVGHTMPAGEELFERQTFKDALPDVSETRLDRTLYAENPHLKPWVEQLRGEKTQHTRSSLASAWSVGDSEAERLAWSLVQVGFFERRGDKEEPYYWVPFLYRDGLGMVQGTAEPGADAS